MKRRVLAASGAAKEAETTQFYRFANRAGDISDKLADWLDESAKLSDTYYSIKNYMSADDIKLLTDAVDLLNDIKKDIRTDIGI